MEEFVVYVLYSEISNRIYVGFTSDLLSRYKYHNKLSRKGFTVRYRPWVVILVEFYSSKKEAMDRELKLKGGQGRQWIKEVIQSEFKEAGFISA